MKKIKITQRSVPLALFIFCILAFGLLIPFLGFYWDDWQMIWYNYSTGPAGLFEAFQGDRPFLGFIFFLTSMITRPVPLNWQIMALLSRFALGLSFWWTIRQIWPKVSDPLVWAAILFIIYPGFKQQPIALIYTNGFIIQASLLLSMGWMICAMRSTGRRYWIFLTLSLLSFTFCHFSEEYYVGLELMRPVIVFLILSRTISAFWPKVIRTIKLMIPYGVIMVIFLAWRVFVFGFPTYQPALIEDSQVSYLSRITYLIYRIFQDIYDTTWLAWIQSFRFPAFNEFSIPTNLYFWAVAAAGFLFSLIYLFKINTHRPQENGGQLLEDYPLNKEMLILGLVALFAAGWPYWITNLPIELTYQYDRFTLPFMIGSAIFLAGLIDWLLKIRYQKIIILSVLIGFTLGSHILNANSYRRDWNTMNDMFWQLTWRAPQIKPNTIIWTHAVPMTYYSDNSLTGPLNLIYAPDNHSLNIPYYFGFLDVRIGQNRSVSALESDLPINQGYRSAMFNGNTNQALVIFYSKPYCLRVLNPAYDKDLGILPNELNDVMAFSNVNQIIADPEKPATLSQPLFLDESPHDWCYYFEKADLARQQGLWEQVVQEGEQAFSQGYQPHDATELLVFIEGYAQTGQWDKSLQTALDAAKLEPRLEGKICDTLIRLKHEVPLDAGNLDVFNDNAAKIHCNLDG